LSLITRLRTYRGADLCAVDDRIILRRSNRTRSNNTNWFSYHSLQSLPRNGRVRLAVRDTYVVSVAETKRENFTGRGKRFSDKLFPPTPSPPPFSRYARLSNDSRFERSNRRNSLSISVRRSCRRKRRMRAQNAEALLPVRALPHPKIRGQRLIVNVFSTTSRRKIRTPTTVMVVGVYQYYGIRNWPPNYRVFGTVPFPGRKTNRRLRPLSFGRVVVSVFLFLSPSSQTARRSIYFVCYRPRRRRRRSPRLV